jgi:TolA-binding protein
MTRNFIYILCIFFCLNSSILAYDIYLRTSDIVAELKIDIPVKFISKTIRNKNSVTFDFNKKIELNISNNFNNKFIRKIEFENNQLEIKFSDSSSYFIRKFDNKIIITVTPKKKINNMYVTNNIEKPLMNKDSDIKKDPVAEKTLGEINNLLKEDKTKEALEKVKEMLNKYKTGYYASEALFRLGLIYLEMGKKSDKYYLEASFVFDNFIKEFPDNFRMVDALWRSAEAKEKAGIYYEAIFAYRKVLNIVPDTETGKQALANIAEIYYKIGQFDKSIDIYKEYMKKYKERPVEILAKTGLVYFKLKDYENAFLYFNEVAEKGIDFIHFDTEILFAMAQTFEIKNRYKDAINIYNKIYNLYPNSKNADVAMYKSGILLEKEGKENLAKQLLMDCKEKYKGKEGALLAALHLAKKSMTNFSSEYWLNFLSDVLNNDVDINLKIEAHYFIIQSYFREERYRICLQLINEFEKNFFDSPLLEKVYDLKQQIYLKQANSAFLSAQLNKADEIAKKLLSEFPESKYKDDAERLLQKTTFFRIKRLYQNKQYTDVINKIEEFYIKTKKIYNLDEWNKLLEDSYIAHIDELEKKGDTKSSMLYARQYLIQIPNGEKNKIILKKLVKYISSDIINNVLNKSYIQAVQIFERDKSWLENSNDIKTYETTKSYVAFALYKLGEKESAIKLINTIKNKTEPKISMLMFLLDLKNSNFNINNLSEYDFKFVINELKIKNPRRALEYIEKYKKNKKLKYLLKYEVINEFNEKDKIELLKKLYSDVSKENDIIKKSVIKLFYDMGLNFYNENKFKKSQNALNEFIKLDLDNESKKYFDKALYFLGMNNLKLQNLDKASEYFQQIIKDFPNSEYANSATLELKDLEWKKKANK